MKRDKGCLFEQSRIAAPPICNLQFAICNLQWSVHRAPAPWCDALRSAHPTPTDRRGAVLIMALVCLVLIGVMGGALLQWAARERKLLRSRDEQSQARWLAEAGLERAAARLAGDANYTGETWSLAACDLPTGQPARVQCHVTTIDGDSEQRSIEIKVEYPLGSPAPARVHKKIVYQLPAGETQ